VTPLVKHTDSIFIGFSWLIAPILGKNGALMYVFDATMRWLNRNVDVGGCRAYVDVGITIQPDRCER
jgi:hypothetical protein